MTTQVPAAMLGADVPTAAQVTAAQNAANTALANAALKLSGDVVQVAVAETGAVATGTTVTPLDDTIPQITEGTEFMTLAITPTNAANSLIIEVILQVSHSAAAGYLIAALHQDAAANALAVMSGVFNGAGQTVNLKFTHKMAAGTTSATTFRVRVGCNNAGTVTFNGQTGARLFGGVLASAITITEIKA